MSVHRVASLLLFASLATSPAHAQFAEAQDESWIPYDVEYIPTPPAVVARMLEVGAVGPGDTVIDLGSGDGRIAIAAAKRGARALGIEIDPKLVEESKSAARAAGVEALADFRVENLFDTTLAGASVVTLYLLPEINLRLRPRLLSELKPGSRVLSHELDMGDWTPDHKETVEGRNFFFWVIPATVVGRWRVETEDGDFTLELKQRYQTIEGRVSIAGATDPLLDASIAGKEIGFAFEDAKGRRAFKGSVEGKTMRGAGWRATRL